MRTPTGLLVGLAVLVGLVGLVAVPPDAVAAPAHRVLLGTVGGDVPSADYGRVAAFDAQAGHRSSTVRVYDAWDTPFPDPLSAAVKAHGQTLVLSVKARTEAGQPVRYADIADATPGGAVDRELQRWARQLRAYGAPVFFSFNHEPDVHKSDEMGTAADYVRAWRHVVTVFRAAGVRNLEQVFIATAPHWAATDARSAASFYPGDDWVDDIAADGYNFFDCSRIALMPWTGPRALFEPFRRFGARHPAKGLMIIEFGSVEDAAVPGRKAAWYAELQAMLTEPGWRQVRAVAPWYDVDQTRSRCNWRIDSSPATLAAFRAWGRDPAYAAVRAVPPATVRQVAVAVAAGAARRTATVTWAPAGPGGARVTAYQVRVLQTGQVFRLGATAGSFRYTPPPGRTGTFTLTVSATNAAGSSAPAPGPPVTLGS